MSSNFGCVFEKKFGLYSGIRELAGNKGGVLIVESIVLIERKGFFDSNVDG